MTLVAIACAVPLWLGILCHGKDVTDMVAGVCTNDDCANPISDEAAMLQSRIDVPVIHQKSLRSLANPVPLPPKFQLENRLGKLIESSSYEYDEQLQLIPWLRNEDRVLQLGGNIGTSCIAAAASHVSLAANLCVEPSNENLKVLKKNIESNKVNVSVLAGIVAESCDDLYMQDVGNDVRRNDNGLHPVQVAATSNKKGQPIKCKSLRDLQAQHGNFNVILADCEGCFPSFLQENFDALKDLEVVVWERDGDRATHSKALSAIEALGLSCPYQYIDGKYGIGRSTCMRSSLATAAWDTAPTYHDGPKWA